MLERHCWGTGLWFWCAVVVSCSLLLRFWDIQWCVPAVQPVHTLPPRAQNPGPGSARSSCGPQPSHHSTSELALGALIAFVHVLADLAACTDVGCFLFACGPAQSSKLCHPLYCSWTFSSKDRIPAGGRGSSSQVLFPGVLSLRLEVFFRILFTVTLLL